MKHGNRVSLMASLALVALGTRFGWADDGTPPQDKPAPAPPAQAVQIPAMDQKAQPQPRDRKQALADICEAVFRWQIEHHEAKQYFLSFGFGKDPHDKEKIPGAETVVNAKTDDPTDAFLKRFAPDKVPVHRASEMTQGKDENGLWGYIDKKTHTHGLIFWITGVTWIDDDTVDVAGGGAAASLSGNGGIFLVAWKDGHWSVQKYDLNAMY